MSTGKVYNLSHGHAYCIHSPSARNWNLLATDELLPYKPTNSNIILHLSLRTHRAENLNPPTIYNLTVWSLVEVASAIVSIGGKDHFPRSGQNSTFTTPYSDQKPQFMMTAFEYLPVYAVIDALRGFQELTHYLLFLELAFEVFSDSSPTSSPIASGCLAHDCRSQSAEMVVRDLEYVNSSATNSSAAPSRQLQSLSSLLSLIHLTTSDEVKPVTVTYGDLDKPLAIHDQSFADVATRMLANITDLIIANQGDGLLPFQGSGKTRLLHYVDTWGSNLGISLLASNLPGAEFTLGQAAMALKTTQDTLNNGPMLESRLKIVADGLMVGWGCLSYSNSSALRCLMPAAGSGSSVGSRKGVLSPLDFQVLTGFDRISLGCGKRRARS